MTEERHHAEAEVGRGSAPRPSPASRPAEAGEQLAEVSYQLPRIREEVSNGLPAKGGLSSAPRQEPPVKLHPPRALVVVYGKDARAVVEAVADAGMHPIIPYTDDRPAVPRLKHPHDRVWLGKTASRELFGNAYAILSAADLFEANVILLTDSAGELAHDDLFLACAGRRGMQVYALVDPDRSGLGWALCTTDREAPEDERWVSCPRCGLRFDAGLVASRGYTCPSCGGYYRMTSEQRIDDLVDTGTFEEWAVPSGEVDPLDFPGYREKLEIQRAMTGLEEAVRCGCGRIAGMSVALAVMDSSFLMGSMGSVVGERLARMFDRATLEGLPVIIFTASGGARMQEGLVSLMQMAKVSCAVERHAMAGLLYLSVLTDPTTGGVTASFAMQGDIVLAEPEALIGFAGKRVIRDTIRKELPEGFQTAEFALAHGLVDAIVPRQQMRTTLAYLLAVHATRLPMGQGSGLDAQDAGAAVAAGAQEQGGVSPEAVRRALEAGQSAGDRPVQGTPTVTVVESGPLHGRPLHSLVDWIRNTLSPEVIAMRRHHDRMVKERYELDDVDSANSAWASVQLVRDVHRPTASYYIERIVDGFIELHGDRMFADDAAIMAGVGWIEGHPVTVIAQEKGADLQERIRRNFGCPQPEGYRKSLRLMRQAEKFNRPIVCLVDTQGAFCDTGSEERGQGNAIADNLLAMAGLRVPVISVLIGEGGSGGALALAVANRVGMQEHAVYSVLSPEGFASILWKDRSRAADAAASMRMNADQVRAMGVVDDVLSEGDEPAHVNPSQACEVLRGYLVDTLDSFAGVDPEELVRQRHERFARY
ncbi:MAG: acetyl-CoA carboxylase, carboxyltransferase subunit beta [Actinomycetota bacterium]|nr:acetyl-CoA carboxylase, carboxyltransferase subunit beta [Actinomycetota bacterium]